MAAYRTSAFESFTALISASPPSVTFSRPITRAAPARIAGS
jgi:hypothetical protein